MTTSPMSSSEKQIEMIVDDAPLSEAFDTEEVSMKAKEEESFVDGNPFIRKTLDLKKKRIKRNRDLFYKEFGIIFENK